VEKTTTQAGMLWRRPGARNSSEARNLTRLSAYVHIHDKYLDIVVLTTTVDLKDFSDSKLRIRSEIGEIEPRAKSQEPRAKSQEPRAKSQEPRSDRIKKEARDMLK
jgi:hypothetical protein